MPNDEQQAKTEDGPSDQSRSNSPQSQDDSPDKTSGDSANTVLEETGGYTAVERAMQKGRHYPFWHPACWAILAVRFYQVTISPMLGPCCRFTPSCSHYYILAVQKYGLIRGSLYGAWRILRCNPFNKGGEDWP